MATLLRVQVVVTTVFLFIALCSALPPGKREPMTKQLEKGRYRRGLGYRTICIEKRKTFCTLIEYGGVLKKYCITKNTLHCTGLD